MSRDDLELVVLMGLQASGKTTFRQTQFDRTHVIVSKDLFQNHRKPQKRQMQLIEAALRNHDSVVVDNTNPRVEDRLALIEIARRFDARVRGFFFWSVLSESIARNSLRVGKSRVPDIGLFATAKVLRRPSYAEGFDELYLVRIEVAQGFVVEPYTEGRDGTRCSFNEANFNELPVWQRRGTGIYWERFEKQGVNPMTGELVKTERRRVKVDESIPMGVEYDDFIRRVMDGQ